MAGTAMLQYRTVLWHPDIRSVRESRWSFTWILEVKADGPADVDKLFHLPLLIGTVIIVIKNHNS